jgi:tRNA1Val (adenine37-N6)-methyltransferase
LKPFKFKQFTVEQDRCAMKIGTDGVLLGAWVSIKNNPFSILDIGAGTGIIALQLAQR